METKVFILIIVAIVNFLMATVIFLKNRRSPMNLSFALFFYSSCVWTFGIAMFMNTLDMEAATAWARIYYFAPTVIVLAFLIFANYYIYKLHELDIIKVLYIFLPFLFIIFVIFHPTFLIEKATHHEWGNDANEKLFGHLIFAVYLFCYIFWAYVILFQKLKSLDGVNRRNLIIIIIGTIISFIIGIISDLIFPLLGSYKFIWVGPAFTLIALLFLAYIIFYRQIKIVK